MAPTTTTTTATTATTATTVKIGVLALQGAFVEHIHMLRRLQPQPPHVVEVRTADDLNDPALDALIIPGGESTTMAIVAEQSGLLAPLRAWVASGRPVWGTCAGLIMIANEAARVKQDGQTLVGGLDVGIVRNYFGTQVDSFQAALHIDGLAGGPFPAVFIRAPVIARVGDGVKVLARVDAPDGTSCVVAVQQRHLLGTSFHPELTADTRLHALFVDQVRQSKGLAPLLLPTTTTTTTTAIVE